MTDDAFVITVRNRVPLVTAFLSGALLVPASMLASVAGMAMTREQSIASWAAVTFLVAQPLVLAAAVVAGFLCYRRFSRWRFVIAVAPPMLSLLGMKVFDGL